MMESMDIHQCKNLLGRGNIKNVGESSKVMQSCILTKFKFSLLPNMNEDF